VSEKVTRERHARTGPLLEAQGLKRRYGQRLVLDLERIEVQEGEVLAVLGPNGAGKSTLFRLLLLLERPDAGRILLGGSVAVPADARARGRVAGVFQQPYLFAGTVRQNLEFGLKSIRLRGSERAGRVARALQELGLAGLENRDVRLLSGGEAQRVALARALVLEPDVLLLDEPTSSLDVTIQRQFREDLGRVTREHARSVILITHDPSDAFAAADRVLVMQEGRVAQVARPHDLVVNPATPFVAAFTGAELLLDGRVDEEDVEGLARVQLRSDAGLWVTASKSLPRGTNVHVSYRPEDVVLSAVHAQFQASPRNVFRLRVGALTPSGGFVRVGLEGAARLVAIITRSSMEELGLVAGAEVNVHLKVAALRAFRAASA
jgi:molybdopterin-binding protein